MMNVLVEMEIPKSCFGGGWFLVTIDTPEGSYGYHYEDKYWDMFHCKELEKAKHWDGYTEEDVGRLMSLHEDKNAKTEPSCSNCKWYRDYTKWCCFCNITIDGRCNPCAIGITWRDPYNFRNGSHYQAD